MAAAIERAMFGRPNVVALIETGGEGTEGQSVGTRTRQQKFREVCAQPGHTRPIRELLKATTRSPILLGDGTETLAGPVRM